MEGTGFYVNRATPTRNLSVLKKKKNIKKTLREPEN